MNQQITEISKNVLRNCLGLRENESFLIVTDDAKKEIADAVYEAGKQLGSEAMMVVMKERQKSGEEPPAAISIAMANADVVLCITEHSLTHTQARKNAVKVGARLATMPGITEDMFLEGAISADYAGVMQLTNEVTERLTKGSKVRIEKEGHVLTFSIAERQGIPSTGVYVNPGESGNLPSGEAYIAPVEGSGEGQIRIDGSFAGIGKLSAPVLLTVERGRIIRAEGEGPEAEQLLRILGDGDGRLLGEFGIGTNNKARITGVVLEDEKVYGTIHVAFGSNNTFGGTISAGVHIDGVVTKPNVFIDDVMIMEQGKLIESL
ncbi:aminopeptidase [Paenibacillus filicis]|uniref:Aminopeptidase n=1 Tax=Paenibacillus gyeongsangnamensis TaxID=3388067 RepID=A0ABT4QE18_9BACL|nr:aminopeptidase [Paenibacillus filicis]MCZ8515117.1 aminopeptidase [Paenibacillus filicis]